MEYNPREFFEPTPSVSRLKSTAGMVAGLCAGVGFGLTTGEMIVNNYRDMDDYDSVESSEPLQLPDGEVRRSVAFQGQLPWVRRPIMLLEESWCTETEQRERVAHYPTQSSALVDHVEDLENAEDPFKEFKMDEISLAVAGRAQNARDKIPHDTALTTMVRTRQLARVSAGREGSWEENEATWLTTIKGGSACNR